MPDITARDTARHARLAGIDASAVELLAARHPAERGAALTLAVAQRDLAVARSSSPEQIADEPRLPGEPWTDAATAYAAWLDRMIGFEAWARQDAAVAVADGYTFDRHTNRAVGPLAGVVAAALRRARTAIALMPGLDEPAAAAAREDVLHAWRDDDRLALLGFGAPPTTVDQLLGVG